MALGQGLGNPRMDAAIDHFGAMGYEVRDVRSAVAELLKVYGGDPAAWPFLEEASYHVVQEKLLEMEEEKHKQLLLEHHQEKQPDQQEEVDAAGVNPPTQGWISHESDTASEIEDGEI